MVRFALTVLGSVALGALTLAACGGGAAVGESCSRSGSIDECHDGAICDTDLGGSLCLKICADDKDCAGTEACNGVSSSNIKACHTKTK